MPVTGLFCTPYPARSHGPSSSRHQPILMKLATAATFAVLCLACPLGAQEPDSVVPPRLLNADVVKKTLDEAYPPGLSRSGVGGWMSRD